MKIGEPVIFVYGGKKLHQQEIMWFICEKIQTADFKRKNISKVLGNKYKIVYIYCLSDWFKDNCKKK